MSHTSETAEKPKREQRERRGPKGERRERREGKTEGGEQPRRPLPAALADRPSMEDMKAEQAVFRAQSKAAFDKIEILKASREVLNTEISTGDKGHSSTAGAHKLLRAERAEISKALDAVFQEQHAIQSELKRVDEQRRGLLSQLPFKDEETAQKMIKQLDNERMHGSLSFDEENQNIAEKKTIIKSLPLLETLTTLKGRRAELLEKKDALSKQISEGKAKRADVDKRLDAAGFDPDAHQAARNAAFKKRDLLNEQITALYNEVSCLWFLHLCSAMGTQML
ncbi:hypothetical protein KIPB_008829 [Kipferlia bialata]|uniref:Uncharacterized protein n=1 Tax=Kipferlia bialata TaxID=797122 RepID=A0A9K3D193_9EUKA|nr:hypothetical protein KIPB_008829 [Kipferlia bialata]|eukprot:g8829.t1